MIRPGTPQDARFLRDMLRHAYYWRSSGTEDETGLHPMRYVENWGRPGDAAVIALDEGFPVGAAWYRTFKENAPGTGSSTSARRSSRSPSCRAGADTASAAS